MRQRNDPRHGGPEWRCRLTREEHARVERLRAELGLSRAEYLLRLAEVPATEHTAPPDRAA